MHLDTSVQVSITDFIICEGKALLLLCLQNFGSPQTGYDVESDVTYTQRPLVENSDGQPHSRQAQWQLLTAASWGMVGAWWSQLFSTSEISIS